jgi:hypothetical protein
MAKNGKPPLNPEVIPPKRAPQVIPDSAGNRVKAYRLRKATAGGKQLPPIDALWLADYEHHHPNKNGNQYSKSRKARKISATFDLEEQAESVSKGGDSPAVTLAAAALQSQAEGQRLDYLTAGAINALEKAVKTYRSVCRSMQGMLETYQIHHLEALDSVRAHHIARTQAESALHARLAKDESDENGNPLDALMAGMAAKYFGIDPAELLAAGQLVAAEPKTTKGPPQKRSR